MREVIEAAKRVTGVDFAVVEEARRPGDPPMLVAASRAGPRACSAGTPRKPEIETMIADAWAWHQANPDGYAQRSA